MKNLIIVESPTKAKTITKFLGKNFQVESSFGHVRDLPKRSLGIDFEKNFKPKYVIPTSVKKNVAKLKKLAKSAETVYFATDEDREGEAIAWHLSEVLNVPANKLKRITFHEITPQAIHKALEEPRDINTDLVDAQQARRILDRLVGYELSPLLWKKVAKGLSAGRVQSVAVRLIVEREREIKDFKKQEYWSIKAMLENKNKEEITAQLNKINDTKLKKLDISSKKQVDDILNNLKNAEFVAADIKKKKIIKNPLPPFTTSTIQQEANKRFNWSAKQTMFIAQQLYEGIDLGDKGSTGLVTYMRTDSLNLSDTFTKQTESMIKKKFGDKYSSGSRTYKTKSKSAQEAHEAIRPTDPYIDPESIKKHLNEKQFKLYDLIWRRAVASQMTSAVLEATSIDIEANNHTFRATGSTVTFDGFYTVYPTTKKDELLPNVENKEKLELKKLEPTQHFTEPPPRYSEATLVKILEEYGIGRPSTYAPTIATIQNRNYIKKEGKHLIPTDIADVVNDLLVEHFTDIVDYSFTAKMEDDLDQIAEGKREWEPTIKHFYTPFKQNLDNKMKELSKKEITEEETDEICDKCGKSMVIKTGRFGKFLACTGFPECRNTKQLKKDENGEIKSESMETDEICDKCGKSMIMKTGRFGPFIACSGYPECKNIKSITKPTGVKCTKCETGDILERRSKRGRTFYGCSTYPKCDFALWNKPTGEVCPDCKSLIVEGAKWEKRCSNKECEHEPNLHKSNNRDDKGKQS